MPAQARQPQFRMDVLHRIEVCGRKLTSVSFQSPFELLFSTSEFEYDAVVAQTLSYSNPEELRVRVTGQPKGSGNSGQHGQSFPWRSRTTGGQLPLPEPGRALRGSGQPVISVPENRAGHHDRTPGGAWYGR